MGLDAANALLDVATVAAPDVAEPLQTGLAMVQAILGAKGAVQSVDGFLNL